MDNAAAIGEPVTRELDRIPMAKKSPHTFVGPEGEPRHAAIDAAFEYGIEDSYSTHRRCHELNARRGEQDSVYLCVDGVHALGIEEFTLPDLNGDFRAVGTHKWLFGPRGTGVLWGRSDAWTITRPTSPTWEAVLYTHERNQRALAVYEGAGYRRDGFVRESDFRGVRLREPRLVKTL